MGLLAFSSDGVFDLCWEPSVWGNGMVLKKNTPLVIAVVLRFFVSAIGLFGPAYDGMSFDAYGWDCTNVTTFDTIEQIANNGYYNDSYESLDQSQKERVRAHMLELNGVIRCVSRDENLNMLGSLWVEYDHDYLPLAWRKCWLSTDTSIKAQRDTYQCVQHALYPASFLVDY